jgi:hypothetical protein
MGIVKTLETVASKLLKAGMDLKRRYQKKLVKRHKNEEMTILKHIFKIPAQA